MRTRVLTHDPGIGESHDRTLETAISGEGSNHKTKNVCRRTRADQQCTTDLSRFCSLQVNKEKRETYGIQKKEGVDALGNPAGDLEMGGKMI
jgi:hypothetical protein